MRVEFNRVSERDVDLIVLDAFVNDPEFATLFFKVIEISDAKVTGVIHSKTDVSLGESDITVFAVEGDTKYALLIEDKIDAKAMPEQYGRYVQRAELLKKSGEADVTYIFMVAPQRYRDTNPEAGKYPNYVSYEEMYQHFCKINPFKAELIASAMEKEKQGYVPIADINVTSFWQAYYQYKREHYNHLILREIEGERGSRASWVTFKTNNKYIEIWHKSDRGYVDMQISGLGEAYEYVRTMLSDLLDEDMNVVRTGKSAAVRIVVNAIDFKKSFSEYADKEIPKAFEAVSRLFRLSSNINYDKLCKDIERARKGR